MFIIKFFLKLLLVPVWLILTFICLVIGLFVTIYGTGRSIAALILSALFLGAIFCYHDWLQAILLICNFVYRCCNAGLPGTFTKKSSSFDHGMNSIERGVLWDISMEFLKEQRSRV